MIKKQKNKKNKKKKKKNNNKKQNSSSTIYSILGLLSSYLYLFLLFVSLYWLHYDIYMLFAYVFIATLVVNFVWPRVRKNLKLEEMK